MRTHNIYQDIEAARLNAIQCLKEDKSVRHVIYGERTTYDSPMTVYNNPIVFYHDETYQQYINRKPADVLYIIHWSEEY